MNPQSKNDTTPSMRSARREHIDAETYQTITDLGDLGCSTQLIQNLLGQRSPRRIRAMIQQSRAKSGLPDKRETRPVSSFEWFLDDPRRLVSGYIVYTIYINLREMRRQAGQNVNDPIKRARLYMDAYNTFLRVQGESMVTAEIKFNRMLNLLNFCEGGSLVVRTCKRCRSGYLADQRQHSTSTCQSCSSAVAVFCTCGRVIEKRNSFRGRRSWNNPRCDVCLDQQKSQKKSDPIQSSVDTVS